MRSGRRFINPLDLNVQRVPKRNPIPLAESEIQRIFASRSEGAF